MNNFICLLVLLIGLSICFGSCNEYTDKESCMNACACCWTEVEVGRYKSYPVMDYRCRWFCNGVNDGQYDPTWFCYGTHLAVPFFALAVILLAVACVLVVLGIIGVCVLVALAFIWDQVRSKVISWLGSNAGTLTVSVLLSGIALTVLCILALVVVAIVVGIISMAYSILRVLFS